MGTGGRRYGAGRPGHKPHTTVLRSIDVRRMASENCLVPGYTYQWSWWNDAGEVVSSIDLNVSGDGVAVSYSTSGRAVSVFVPVERTRCNYGGSRPWFVCPHCQRRVALLYLGNDVGCRQCFGMTYPCQSEDEVDRLRRRKARIQARLGDGKRKTTATIERLNVALVRIEREITRAMVAYLGRQFGPETLADLDLP